MPRTRGFYCVAQYIPDDGRAEAANVGVVLFIPSDGETPIRVRMSRSLARVRRFFAPGPDNMLCIAGGVGSLARRLTLNRSEFADEYALKHFAAARADSVRITAPRLVMVEDPAAELDALYNELATDPDEVEPTAYQTPDAHG